MALSKANTQRCNEALKAFQKQYPSITSADIQTFILGFTAATEMLLSPEEVKNMLLACFMYSSANNNQGLSTIEGFTFGDQVQHIIHTVLNNPTLSMSGIVPKLRRK